MSLKLLIDNRESELKEYFKDKTYVECLNLDLGDICFKKDEEVLLVIERKTINDLSSSICDGRYREQKTRLLGCFDREKIMYLIEGNINIQTSVKGGISTLVGSLINTQFRDGIKVYKTASIKETIYFIEKLFKKLEEDLEIFWKYNTVSNVEYSATLKIKKKDNVTSDLWFHKQLTLIPQISSKIAEIVTSNYKSVKELVIKYETIEDINERKELLKDLTYMTSTGKSRKIGKKISERIYSFYG